MNRLAAFLLLLALPAFAAGDLDQAKTDFAAGRFREAAEAAGRVGEGDPDYARARYLIGEIALVTDDLSGAEAAFREALAAKEAEPILTGLGRALLAQGETEEAVKVLDKAVAANAKSGRAHCFLGIARHRESLGEKGTKEIDQGLKLAGDDPVVVQAAVLFWLDAEKPDKAEQVADKFRKANKKHPLGHFLRALALERGKEYDDAIESYRKAIELDDNFLDAHKNLAIVCIAQNPLYQNKKRTELAMKHFERYFALGGKDAEVKRIHETLKQFLAQNGR
jgi:tetratricopeptide (TPR) repeat protein